MFFSVTGKWIEADDAKRCMHIMRLLNATDVSSHERRMEAVKALLYIAQGKRQIQALYVITRDNAACYDCCRFRDY